MFIRARYGHGGRIGYDKEWRAKPAISGGGELLDQGVHLIDLSRWFLGDFTDVQGHVATFFWDMPVEDNGFLLLRTAEGQVAWLHASWTEWKNLSRSRSSDATPSCTSRAWAAATASSGSATTRCCPQMGPPETTIWEYPGEDNSWRDEFEAFTQAVAAGRGAPVTLRDAHAALTVVHRVYAASRRR